MSNVGELSNMFRDAISFNQNLSTWNIDNVYECYNFNLNTPQWTLPKPNLDPSCLE